MVREGTRSQTGNSKPRVFTTPDTAPATARKAKPKAKKPTTATAGKGAKPMGVTKKPAAKKAAAAGTKKDGAGKAEKKVEKKSKETKAAKPKDNGVDAAPDSEDAEN